MHYRHQTLIACRQAQFKPASSAADPWYESGDFNQATCHPERSEGRAVLLLTSNQVLRFAQDDN
jgi:hypothetical protein